MKSRIDQNWLQRVRHKADIAEELDKMEKKLKDAFDTFMVSTYTTNRSSFPGLHNFLHLGHVPDSNPGSSLDPTVGCGQR
jgi:hypothetical protein